MKRATFRAGATGGGAAGRVGGAGGEPLGGCGGLGGGPGGELGGGLGGEPETGGGTGGVAGGMAGKGPVQVAVVVVAAESWQEGPVPGAGGGATGFLPVGSVPDGDVSFDSLGSRGASSGTQNRPLQLGQLA